MEEVLNQQQIARFIHEGFVRIDNAFPAALAAAARDILWQDLPADPDDPATWTQPVIRLGMYTQPPFVAAANTPVLHRAFDQLAGPGKWMPCKAMGTFPVRFPSPDDPGDAGWHVDVSFAGADAHNYLEWRVNRYSKGRALLMLFLFSDVGEQDAPTRIRPGSHLEVARELSAEGEGGLSLGELAARLAERPEGKVTLATGKAGTVYLCHPFLVHAAQPHHGREPRFLAQPPLFWKEGPGAGGIDNEDTPVAAAIRLGLNG
ncbi:phytanoyl-CoA dioxygenase family protein [Chitinophaga japonensis]|uniref:Phytanoyl-CoA dioxygenase PhyH n=1 Tax=Chitinophaga japonensis TaxID=104662 RepID=A0A562SZS1_CHIJA|nr:phytanoyl-CoA dioxygenase family protein [Chitinophaga japonensis]TWI86742.1 phytanoyl-CoA dioxygenase PhyH [Chitinophaga japonensis]